jgi:hypothetical protein
MPRHRRAHRIRRRTSRRAPPSGVQMSSTASWTRTRARSTPSAHPSAAIASSQSVISPASTTLALAIHPPSPAGGQIGGALGQLRRVRRYISPLCSRTCAARMSSGACAT